MFANNILMKITQLKLHVQDAMKTFQWGHGQTNGLQKS